MSNAVKQIGQGVTNAGQQLQTSAQRLGSGDVVGAGQAFGASSLDVGTGIFGGGGTGEMINNIGNPGGAPAAPGVNPGLASLQQQQLQNAQSFRQGIPQMENQMGQQLKAQGNSNLSAQNQATNNSNNARGLMYGGINQGQQLQNRTNEQSQIAQGTSQINANVNNAANTLDAQAIETGVGIQQSQQAIQNSIYSTALAQLNSQNQLTSSALGTATTAGLMFALG